MPVFKDSVCTMYTSSTGWNAGTKTLIVSTHGALAGTTFTKAYPTVIKFATPKGGALIADLKECIKGNVTESEISIGGKATQDDYNLTHFEHDPPQNQIVAALAGNTKVDVITLNPGQAMKLSELVTWLGSTSHLKYPAILCIFCRVQGGEYFTYTGGKSQTASTHNTHQVNATAIALELKAKGKTT